MKRNRYTEIICREFCTFYKEGREELTCGSYRFLAEILAPGELESRCGKIGRSPDFSCDREIREAVCMKCDFLVDGCDFREGLDAPPCGGYAIVEGLMKRAV